jgi:hypothetical protein
MSDAGGRSGPSAAPANELFIDSVRPPGLGFSMGCALCFCTSVLARTERLEALSRVESPSRPPAFRNLGRGVF